MAFAEATLRVVARLHHQVHNVRPRPKSLIAEVHRRLPPGSELTLQDVDRAILQLHARSRRILNGGSVRIRSAQLRALLPLKSSRQPGRGKPTRRRRGRNRPSPELVDAIQERARKLNNPGLRGLSLNLDVTNKALLIRGDLSALTRAFNLILERAEHDAAN